MAKSFVSQQRKMEIISRDGVVSCGEGEENGERAVIIGVDPQSGLGPADFPGTIEGYPVYVEDERPPRLAKEMLSHRQHHRPVRCGTSTQNVDSGGGHGTMGPLMTDGTHTYLTSNYHVWGDDGASVGDRVVQPSDFDADTPTDERIVGHVEGWIEPGDEPVTVDMAWARVADGVQAVPQLNEVGPITGVRSPEVGDKLVKSGRKTGVTRGEVETVSTGVGVGYPMTDVIKVTGMTDTGDSGSPVLHDDGSGDLAGVVFAGDAGGPTYICDVDNWEAESGMVVITQEERGFFAELLRAIVALISGAFSG